MAAVHRQPHPPQEELGPLLTIIEDTVTGLVDEGWHVNPVGALDLLPDNTARVLKDAAEATAGNPGLLVNVAVGYGGRREDRGRGRRC